MVSYRIHLQGLGLSIEGSPPVYAIEKEGGQYTSTFYDPVERRIALGSDWDVYGLLVMYGHYALTPADAPTGNLGRNVLSGALSDYLAWSYLSEIDPESLSGWSTARATDRNLGELLPNLVYGRAETWYVRALFREALLDAEAEIGANELGRLIVSTWRRTSVSLPAQTPDEAVRGFVEQLRVDENVAAAISVAFAKVGLVVLAAEVESAD